VHPHLHAHSLRRVPAAISLAHRAAAAHRGLSYEVIRFAASGAAGCWPRSRAPGLWLQRITTKPPADDQTAVAIRALEGAMALEEAQGGQLVIA